jgi:20S proteasome alpha/beta subunit
MRGFAVSEAQAYHAIGIDRWALPILSSLYSGYYPERSYSLEYALCVAVFSAWATHKWSCVVGGDFDVVTITEDDGVKFVCTDEISRLTHSASCMFDSWLSMFRERFLARS